MVHHRPGSNKLTNEKSYAHLTDREKSVSDGDRAMYPPVRGDGVAREGDAARDRGRRRRSMFGFGGERLIKLSLLVVKRRIIKKVS